VIKFINEHKANLISLIDNIDEKLVENIIKQLEKVSLSNGIVYILGNGGSASTASHMVNDLTTGLARRDIRNFNIISLSDNIAVCTALANDVGYENIFYYQLKNKVKKNDLIIAISCSGNSPNITKAVKYAKKFNTTVLGLTGFDGGELKELSDINFHVNTKIGEYGLVEDLHMILNHIIYSYYISTKKN
jgi:D-sedoheptulose 7-phosphate isomerase